MKESKRADLKVWIDTLDLNQLRSILYECIIELEMVETIRFWDDSTVPHWDATGDHLDGSPYEEEE